MFMRSFVLAAGLGLGALPAIADEATNRLLTALGLEQVIEIMHEEGVGYGDTLADDMLNGNPPANWPETMQKIYDKDRMLLEVQLAFAEWMEETDPTPLLEFYEGSEGQEVVRYEVSARRAMMDEAVEEAARASAREAMASPQGVFGLIDDFVETNELIDENVAGGMSANYQFYRGLIEGGAVEMSEDDALREVYESEPELRVDTEEWVYGFLLLAYSPLDTDLLKRHVEQSKTVEGRAMNRALFSGFDQMYRGISYALGLAVAQAMGQQEL